MSNKEEKDLNKFWDNFQKKVTKTPEASIDFLVELGVITKKGNLKKAYKDICTPSVQE